MTKVIIKPADGTGAVDLYHDAAKKFETAAGGTIVTGAIQVNHTGGNGLTITSPTNECNIILTNDARSWKIVNYDYAVGADQLGFHDGTADRMIIKNNGNVQIPDGDLEIANGHGIDFASTSDAAGKTSELLDDYEEGSFTMTAANNVGTSQPLHSGIDALSYIKIGRLVYIQGRILFTTGTPAGTGQLILAGLPFTTSNTLTEQSANHQIAINTHGQDLPSGFVSTFLEFTNNAVGAYCVVQKDNASWTALDVSWCSDGDYIALSGCYITDS